MKLKIDDYDELYNIFMDLASATYLYSLINIDKDEKFGEPELIFAANHAENLLNQRQVDAVIGIKNLLEKIGDR